MRTFKEKIESLERTHRAVESCKEIHGLVIGHRTREQLIKSWFTSNGMLDGRIRKTMRLEVAGQTFPVKDTLKGLGFKWDAQEKVWFVIRGELKTQDVACLLRKQLSQK